MSKGSSGGDKVAFSGMKILVQGIIHSDASGTIMRIGDQNALGKRYAMKVVKRDDPADDLYVELAKCHYTASQKMGHPSLLKYHDFQLKRSWFKVVRAELLMEYVAGKAIDKLPKVGVGHQVQIFRQAVAGLAHLHRRDMRHGDLQPSHVLLTKNGDVKVLGYGLNLLPAPLLEKFNFNRGYMAPEQSKRKSVSDKADVYSFGAIMYQLLTGQSANQGRRAQGEVEKLPIPARLNTAVTADLSNLVVSCLSTHPDKRPASMYDLQVKLDAIAKDMGVSEISLKGLATEDEEKGE